MKQVKVNVTIDIIVDVEDDVSMEGAEHIALFNVEPIVSNIPMDLNKKLISLDVEDYHVNSTEQIN